MGCSQPAPPPPPLRWKPFVYPCPPTTTSSTVFAGVHHEAIKQAETVLRPSLHSPASTLAPLACYPYYPASPASPVSLLAQLPTSPGPPPGQQLLQDWSKRLWTRSFPLSSSVLFCLLLSSSVLSVLLLLWTLVQLPLRLLLHVVKEPLEEGEEHLSMFT